MRSRSLAVLQSLASRAIIGTLCKFVSWLLAHAELVVGAPDGDVLDRTATAAPFGAGEAVDVALEMDEDAIAALVLQTGDGRLAISPI